MESARFGRLRKTDKPGKILAVFRFLEPSIQNLGFTFSRLEQTKTETSKSTQVFRSRDELLSAE